jgi:hypothetical protein
MRNILIFCLVVALVACAGASQKQSLKGWPAILQDYRDGLITLDEKALLALTLLTNPKELPQKYQIDRPMKDATIMLLDIMSTKDGIDPSIINQYFLALDRVNKQKYYDTPEGNFRIHYDTAGPHAVYQPNVDIDPADGVPDYVNRTAEYFVRAWHYQCDTLGYDTPPFDGSNGGGSNLYDVYMHSHPGAYGMTWGESYTNQRPNRNYDMISYIHVDPTFDGFGYNDRRLPMQVTSAHEFFHAVQFAYNANAGGWFMENCAVWMEETMWDEVNDCYAYMPYFFNNPHLALTTYNGSFEYGAFVWPTYLDENYGSEIIRTIWEWSIPADAFNAMLAALSEFGSGIENDYPTFATWNFITGARDDSQHYKEGGSYSQVRIMRTHTLYPVNNNTSNQPPNNLGCNYILFAIGNNSGILRIQFDGADNGDWAVPVVKSISARQHELDAIEIDSHGEGEIVIPNIENYAGVTIIPCLVYGPTSNYVYNAQITTGIDDENQNLPGNFAVYGNYPNPFNNQTVISFEVPDVFAGNAEIEIFDQLGRKITNTSLIAHGGINNIPLDFGKLKGASSGLYFYRITVGKSLLTGKMTYLK